MRRYYGSGYHEDLRPSLLTLITLGAACLAVALSVLVFVGHRSPVQPRVLGNQITRLPFTTNPPAPAPPSKPLDEIGSPPGSKPEPASHNVRPPAPTSRCRNSVAEACGRFFWSPAAAKDSPLRIDAEINPATVAAGEEVTYTVTAKDGDATIVGIVARFGDGTDKGPTLIACAAPHRYGPWTPPARQAGKKTVTFRHVYAKAGSYKASFTARSGACGSPYGGTLTLPVDMVVEASRSASPAPSASPSAAA
jgi:hypothetical protein